MVRNVHRTSSGPRVDPLDPAGRGLLADDEVRDDGRRHHDVAGDDRRGGYAYQVAALVVRRAALGPWHAFGQIDAAVVAEVADRFSAAGVDRDQVRLARAPEDAGVVAVAPVGEAARPVGRASDRRLGRPAGRAPRGSRRLPASTAAAWVERGGQVEHAVDHQRRRLQAADRDRPVVIAGPERVRIDRAVGGPPAPGDAEIVEVAGVDLVERGVTWCCRCRRRSCAIPRRRPYCAAAGWAAITSAAATAARPACRADMGSSSRNRAAGCSYRSQETWASARIRQRCMRLSYIARMQMSRVRVAAGGDGEAPRFAATGEAPHEDARYRRAGTGRHVRASVHLRKLLGRGDILAIAFGRDGRLEAGSCWPAR